MVPDYTKLCSNAPMKFNLTIGLSMSMSSEIGTNQETQQNSSKKEERFSYMM